MSRKSTGWAVVALSEFMRFIIYVCFSSVHIYPKSKTSPAATPSFRSLNNLEIETWLNLAVILQKLLILIFIPSPISSLLDLTVLGKYWYTLQGKRQKRCTVLFIQPLITTLSQHSDALSWNMLIFSDDASCVFFNRDTGQNEVADVPICSPK